MENDILLQYGLPASKRFVQILHDFVSQREVNDQLLDFVSRKLKTAARKYLLAPVVSDMEQLDQAKEQKKSPYDLLPELGHPVNDYSVFLIGELLYRKNVAATDVLEEMKKVQYVDVWDDILLLSRIVNYNTHELYHRMKGHDLRFIDEFVQHTQQQQTARTTSKKVVPATEGYTPNYRTVNKVQIEDILFDEQQTPSIIGKLKSGSRYIRVTMVLELSQLNDILASAGELGAEISQYIKKRVINVQQGRHAAIDVKAEFGQVLQLDNCYMEVYKPQHQSRGKWVETKDNFYFVDKILSRKEYEKKSKEAEVRAKIEECLELIGGSYGYYQRMRRLGITDEEAKLRAGLQDELLFKLSGFLHKLKD
jgi:septum formation inhibitor MinC